MNQMSNATKRSILRWIHLIFGIPIIGYVYSPFAELPNYAPVVRFVSIPVLMKLWSLNEMERTGGEPDVVGLDKKTGEYIFFDCSAESPNGRRSVCYDREGLESRKEHKPENNAIDMAAAMGIA